MVKTSDSCVDECGSSPGHINCENHCVNLRRPFQPQFINLSPADNNRPGTCWHQEGHLGIKNHAIMSPSGTKTTVICAQRRDLAKQMMDFKRWLYYYKLVIFWQIFSVLLMHLMIIIMIYFWEFCHFVEFM